jgi:hypothetical protein
MLGCPDLLRNDHRRRSAGFVVHVSDTPTDHTMTSLPIRVAQLTGPSSETTKLTPLRLLWAKDIAA